jgi:hypothetical protein
VSNTTFWLVLLVTNPACVFMGFLFGRVTRAAVEMEEHMIVEDSPPPELKSSPDIRRTVVMLRWVCAVVAVIGVGTMVLGVVVTREQAAADARDDRLTACITGYSNALADALEQRTAANSAANQAVDTVMQAFADAFNQAPAEARENLRLAFEKYTEARRQSRSASAQNPLPEAPRDACAELMD